MNRITKQKINVNPNEFGDPAPSSRTAKSQSNSPAFSRGKRKSASPSPSSSRFFRKVMVHISGAETQNKNFSGRRDVINKKNVIGSDSIPDSPCPISEPVHSPHLSSNSHRESNFRKKIVLKPSSVSSHIDFSNKDGISFEGDCKDNKCEIEKGSPATTKKEDMRNDWYGEISSNEIERQEEIEKEARKNKLISHSESNLSDQGLDDDESVVERNMGSLAAKPLGNLTEENVNVAATKKKSLYSFLRSLSRSGSHSEDKCNEIEKESNSDKENKQQPLSSKIYKKMASFSQSNSGKVNSCNSENESPPKSRMMTSTSKLLRKLSSMSNRGSKKELEEESALATNKPSGGFLQKLRSFGRSNSSMVEDEKSQEGKREKDSFTFCIKDHTAKSSTVAAIDCDELDSTNEKDLEDDIVALEETQCRRRKSSVRVYQPELLRRQKAAEEAAKKERELQERFNVIQCLADQEKMEEAELSDREQRSSKYWSKEGSTSNSSKLCIEKNLGNITEDNVSTYQEL